LAVAQALLFTLSDEGFTLSHEGFTLSHEGPVRLCKCAKINWTTLPEGNPSRRKLGQTHPLPTPAVH